MENNENKVSPISKLRAQANITKNTVTNPKLDVFGNSEAGSTPTPEVKEELGVVVPNTPVIVGDDGDDLFTEIENIVADYDAPAEEPAPEIPVATGPSPAEMLMGASAGGNDGGKAKGRDYLMELLKK